MKKYILFCGIMLGSLMSARAQVYFTQNFSSSTNVSNYVGTTANLFNGITTVGNNAFSIVNGKLRLVKLAGTGTNRGSFTKNSVAGGPARFLKFSIEVTLSGNDAANNNAFQFTVGAPSGTAPAAPGDAQIHSVVRVNPTDTAGTFRIQGGNNLVSKTTFSGTQTLVWFVNNTGSPVGYTDPSGNISTLQNDASDVWVVSGTTYVLAVDEVPAISPNVTLTGFKLANNPSFNATFDMDNIVLSEEPVIFVPKIVSASTVEPITVPIKTYFNLLPLPTEINVTYDDGTTGRPKVVWSEQVPYNQYRTGVYQVLGTIVPVNGTINPDNVVLTTTVTVNEELTFVNAFSPNGDGKNDTWINPILSFYQESSVEVLDRNGKRLFFTTDPNEGWDGKNSEGQVIPGSYLYIIKVPMIQVNKKGVLTIIK